MLTTSASPEDVLRSYQLHANAYVTKPADFDEFGQVVARIDAFYTETARLPGQPEPD